MYPNPWTPLSGTNRPRSALELLLVATATTPLTYSEELWAIVGMTTSPIASTQSMAR